MLLNQAAGGFAESGIDPEALAARLEAAGLSVTLEVLHPGEIDECLDARLGEAPTLVVVGGGDGTIRGVARRLDDTPHVMGLLPLGTMNRFVQNLGLPITVPEAIEVLTTGRDEPVDLAEVNGHTFLNTCALGLYPQVVRLRERLRREHRHWPNLLRYTVDTTAATWMVLRRWRLLRFRLEIDGEVFHHRVPTVAITNNPGHVPVDPIRVGRGLLGIFIPRVTSPGAMVWLTLRTALLGPREVELLEVREVEAAVLQVPRKTPVSLDAEVVTLEPPLHFRARPAACRVRLPKASSP